MRDRADDGVEVHLIRLANIRKAAEAVPGSQTEATLDADRKLESMRLWYKLTLEE